MISTRKLGLAVCALSAACAVFLLPALAVGEMVTEEYDWIVEDILDGTTLATTWIEVVDPPTDPPVRTVTYEYEPVVLQQISREVITYDNSLHKLAYTTQEDSWFESYRARMVDYQVYNADMDVWEYDWSDDEYDQVQLSRITTRPYLEVIADPSHEPQADAGPDLMADAYDSWYLTEVHQWSQTA